MKKIRLGRTGLVVSQLGYGALEVWGTPTEGQMGRLPDEARAGRVLNAALDAGINFFDTSWCYGRSEELMGRYISHRRDEYFLASKVGHVNCKPPKACGYTPGDPHGYSAEDLINCVQESLQRLRTDYLDILQLHNPTPEEVEENGCIETLQRIKARGMTRFIGISTTLPYLDRHLAAEVYDVFQIPYSVLGAEHHDAITRVAENGSGTIIRGVAHKNNPVDRMDVPERWRAFEEAGLDQFLDVGESRNSFLVRFALSHPHAHTLIVGTQNPDHLRDNVTAWGRGPLEPNVYAAVRLRMETAGLPWGPR